MATAYDDLIARAKSRIDMTRSQFVEDEDWQNFANDAYAKLYNLMVGAYEEFFTVLTGELTVNANGQVDVPNDFQRLHAVDMKDGGEWCSVEARPLSHRNVFRRWISAYLRIWPGISYRLIKRQVWFFPETKAKGQKVRLWYNPLPERVTDFATVIPAEMEQWSEYIILEMVIMAAGKEETDDSIWARERMILEAKINDDGQLRSLEASDEIEDVRGVDDDIGYTHGRW
jgi:hypothetical protein